MKTLDELTTYMNDNDKSFGWKSRCEALTDFAEKLEAANNALKKELTEAGEHLASIQNLLSDSVSERHELQRMLFVKKDNNAELERENAELKKLVEQMRNALQNIGQVVMKSEEIPWLYDGDCGATALFGQIDDMCKDALEAAKGNNQ